MCLVRRGVECDTLHQQGIDTMTAHQAMFQMCGVFAEFERSVIRERISAGLARTRANGKKLGRPKIDDSVERSIRDALDKERIKEFGRLQGSLG